MGLASRWDQASLTYLLARGRLWDLPADGWVAGGLIARLGDLADWCQVRVRRLTGGILVIWIRWETLDALRLLGRLLLCACVDRWSVERLILFLLLATDELHRVSQALGHLQQDGALLLQATDLVDYVLIWRLLSRLAHLADHLQILGCRMAEQRL